MSESEIKVVKSPTVPSASSENNIIYYIRLNNGLIATKPEEFPADLDVEAVTPNEQAQE